MDRWVISPKIAEKAISILLESIIGSHHIQEIQSLLWLLVLFKSKSRSRLSRARPILVQYKRETGDSNKEARLSLSLSLSL
jgi:hypothetical protein